MSQREAAVRLGLGVRQVKRLVARYRERGAAGLASGRRGRRPNNAIDASVRRAAVDLVRERYPDFGPTFACEKLVEDHGRRLSRETLRHWMIEDGLWQARSRRDVREHPSRPRRECVGDLVQIDGSPHDWFEGRAPGCTLIAYVDDATTRLLAAGFFEGGDDRGVHAHDARAPGRARSAGGVLLGPLQRLPGQPQGR
ncbi:MAG: helix-turn-helix domain-containing protein [Gammaproteobacteria bacterium]|nr:helix-turn-helix domain-containing protein [Gammaproteobacteria bacterium]